MLPPEAITEFKQIYQDEFGVELSDVEATEKASCVFNLVKAIAESPKLDNRERRPLT